MICAVYRSSKRPNTYLFLTKKVLVMLLTEDKLEKVLSVSKEKLLQELTSNRYWLWIRQEEENLLTQHRTYLSRENDHE